jgi:mRNA-degrading endonuclease toxin of MazEF toxin-antitoxin module
MIEALFKGDIILCKFPMASKGIIDWKKRPGLVVSKNLNNRRLDDIIIAPCSSNISKKRVKTQFLIDGPEVIQSGIRITSVVRCEILMTIHKSMIIARLGSIYDESIEKIDACLIDALDIFIKKDEEY